MIRNVGPHRADDGDVVNVLAEQRENFADLDARLARFLEAERRGEARAAHVAGQGFAVELVERRLRVPGVDMRGCAAGEDVDDAPGLRREVWLPRRKRRVGIRGGCGEAL